jgi:AraC-like DNA-binding protein
VGYRQAAQFAKTFRRHHGRPPSSFRREGRREARLAADGQSGGSASGEPPRHAAAQTDGQRPALSFGTASA